MPHILHFSRPLVRCLPVIRRNGMLMRCRDHWSSGTWRGTERLFAEFRYLLLGSRFKLMGVRTLDFDFDFNWQHKCNDEGKVTIQLHIRASPTICSLSLSPSTTKYSKCSQEDRFLIFYTFARSIVFHLPSSTHRESSTQGEIQ